jgi:hypothetical protein
MTIEDKVRNRTLVCYRGFYLMVFYGVFVLVSAFFISCAMFR